MNQGKNPITNEFDYTDDENEIIRIGTAYRNLEGNAGFYQLNQELERYVLEAQQSVEQNESHNPEIVTGLVQRWAHRKAFLRTIHRIIHNGIEAANLLTQSQENY